MNWFYATDGQKNGPVTEAQLDELLRAGKINQNSMVWHEGMSNWQPMSQVRPAGISPIAPPDPGLTCVECGHSFPPSELIQINHSSVCGACKPVFLQRLSEGAALPSSAGLWRRLDKVVTVNGTVFPDRCIKCNQPANGFRLKRKLYWQPPGYYFLFLICLFSRLFYLIILIILAIVCKKVTVHISLCQKHVAERKRAIVVAWGILGLGLLSLVGSAVFQNAIAIFIIIGLVFFLAAIIYGAVKGRSVVATKITKENAWIKGAKKEFLETLPEWPGI